MISQSVRLSRPLGAGGMGSVWLADHLALKTQVVVKFMSAELGADPANRERFAREAIAASQVKSPHVVQTFDHGATADGTPFIVMEWLEGEDLGQRLRKGPLEATAAASILGQVCLALSRAHAVGIVHRDIKPDNIFLCDVGASEPFVKLLDFGIAKATLGPPPTSRTRTGAMMGTPYYMSPEQFAGAKNIDFRTDLWSLGVVTFQCMTGARPFEAETFGGLVIAVHSGEIPAPSTVRAGLPAAFDAWFLRACARDPAARFQSASEFADAFAISVAGAGASGHAIAGVEPPSPSSRGEGLQTTGAASSLVRGDAPPVGAGSVSPPRRNRRLRVVALMGAAGIACAGVLVFMSARRTHSTAGAASDNPPQVVSSSPAAVSIPAEGHPLDAATVTSAASVGPAQTSAASAASSTTALVRPPHPATPPRISGGPQPPPPPHPTATDPFQPHVF
jgi:serine/threonine protein kinase